jgi:RimJ/RimL family protein N-acetyltransferase
MNKSESGLVIREATKDDAQLYFDWANDPAVRKMAFHQEPIPWENHVKWFNAKLASKTSHLFLCYQQKLPIGQVRFDIIDGGDAEIDISIAKEFRGGGLGKQMLQSAIEYESKTNGIHSFVSEVKEENISSQRMFLAVEFQLVKQENGVCYYHKEY